MQTDHGISQNKTNLPITEIDDFDIDGLGFKPINKGLGFHGERDIKVEKRSSSLKTGQHSFQRKSVTKTNLQHVSENIPLQSPMHGIEHFYGSQSKPALLKKEACDQNAESVIEAKLSSRLVAYLCDCSVILMSSLVVFGLFVLTLYSAMGSSLIQSFIFENIDFFILLNAVIYIIYFSLWDGIGTLGKSLMNIEVLAQKQGKHITMTQLFNRSVVSLLGLFFVIPNVLDLHSRLSGTRTVEKR